MPPSHPLQKALEDWGDSVEKASGGTIKYKVYPSQQLGKAFDHYDMARDGIADLTYINPGYQPGRFPIIGAGELPFLIANAKGGSQALDAWYRKYAATRDEGREVLPRLRARSRHVPFQDQKDHGARRLKGMKIRPAHATVASLVTLLGGTNVQGERARSARHLEKGVADAVTFPWGSIPLFGIDKVTKYHMDAPLYVTTFAFVFNKDTYDQMSAAQKKVIDDHCTNEWAGKVAARGPTSSTPASPSSRPIRRTRSIRSRRAARRMAEVRRAAAKTWADNVKKAGGDPDATMKELKAALKSPTRPIDARDRLTAGDLPPELTAAETIRAVDVSKCGDVRASSERAREAQAGGRRAREPRDCMDRFIDSIEWIAALFVGIVAADVFSGPAALFLQLHRSPTPTISASCCSAS